MNMVIFKYVIGIGSAWATFFTLGGFEHYGPSTVVPSLFAAGIGAGIGSLIDDYIEKKITYYKFRGTYKIKQTPYDELLHETTQKLIEDSKIELEKYRKP